MTRAEPLTFAALDGLAFAVERGHLNVQQHVPVLSADALGPLLEWRGLSSGGLLPFPDEASWLLLEETTPLVAALRDGRRQWICPATRAAGIFRVSASWSENDAKLVSFGLAAQKAAIGNGFHRQVAAQLTSAIVELVSNVYEHSGTPASGIAAFRAGEDAFEFVVADGGIGVLESLRSCPEYGGLTDHGTALRFALRDGVSRYGSAANRGHGFRPILVGLANLCGLLRFRSGDHALVIDGQRIDAMSAKIAQKTRFDGFLVSVSCQLPRFGPRKEEAH